MPMTIIWREPITPDRPAVFWGAEIKRLREGQRLSQRRLAHLAGVDRASLARFECGRSRGNLELVEKLVAVLGYEIDMMWHGFVGGTLPPRSPVALLTHSA
jgi:transcriptional regulator with XRE-family HTH domain